jgi:hypothetical protein
MNFIRQTSDLFSSEFCKKLLYLLEKSKPELIKNMYSFKGLHEEFRNFEYSSELAQMHKVICDKISDEVNKYFKAVDTTYIEKHILESVTVLKIKPNTPLELHHDADMDNPKSVDIYDSLKERLGSYFFHIKNAILGKPKELNRKHITVLMYLQEMEGGELYFPLQKELIKPKPGLAVIFPAFFTHPHTVFPSLDKDRYTYRFNFIIKK